MPISQELTGVTSREGYRLWSRVFDASPTPMQLLEQRILEPLLPSVAGLRVVDLGCGTGRWLERLAARAPASLVGVDSSPEMLDRAGRKLGSRARLLQADNENLPLPSLSAGIALCSFALSHMEDIPRFAGEVKRIMQPCASFFVTDLHPVTVAKFGWQRGFRVDGVHVDIKMESRPLEQIASSFAKAGFETMAVLEPHFGEAERAAFERANKASLFDTLRSYPAIYIIQFRRTAGSAKAHARNAARGTVKRILGARVAINPEESACADIRIDGDRIGSLGRSLTPASSAAMAKTPAIDLSGFLVLPGLINAHDHLEFALFPRLGKGNYRNFTEWAADIHQPDESPVREHRAVPRATRLWWGAIRNLLCGVTTVCHHNPYAARVFGRGFPIRVVRNFGWAHSLPMDSDVQGKRRKTPPGQPFIVHLAEGVDSKSAEEIFDLQRAGALDDETVIVHGLGLDDRGIALLKSSRAALIWCPTSNVFLFGKTHASDTLKNFPLVALGSDSPITAQGDLLDEIRFAHEGVGVPSEELYAQVSTRAAQILRLTRGEGSLRPGSAADIVAVRDRGLTPAETLSTISYRDVELVIVGGRVHLASPRIFAGLPPALSRGLEPLEIEGETHWIRARLAHLFQDAASVLQCELKLGGRRVRCGPAH